MRTGENTSLLVPVNYGAWRGAALNGIQKSYLHDFTEIDDAVVGGRATLLQQSIGRKSAVMRVSINHHPIQVYVKEDNLEQMGMRKLVKDNVQPSHLWRSWQRASQLMEAGIPVQPPIAILTLRRWGVIRKMVYVCEYMPDMTPLSDVMSETCASDDCVAKTGMLKAVASRLRFMHDQGFSHYDLKSSNILVQYRAEHWSIMFIDLESVRRHRAMTVETRAIDLGRLWLALLPLTTSYEREQFLQAYAAIVPALDPVRILRSIHQRVSYLRGRRFGHLQEIGDVLRGRTNRLQRWLIVAPESIHAVEQMEPLLASLRHAFPAVRLDVLVSCENAPVLAQNNDLDETIIMTRFFANHGPSRYESISFIQIIKLLHSRRYHVAVDLSGSVVSAVLTRVTGADVRIGYRTSSTVLKWLKRITCYTQMILFKPEYRDSMRQYLLVAEALGVESVKPRRHVAVALEERPVTTQSIPRNLT
jgi:tRNA A-37 threonylcarbamoyl transferase component Bud32